MCGITGVFSRNEEPVSLELIRRMTDTITHRGPDSDGYFTDGPIGLGHRRLAIIDLSPTGHQPMHNETGDITLIYNGELFNFQNLRNELTAAGHFFFSHSDTEVIIHAYEEWGERCLERFNGQFAFALWDAPRKRLFLARDRFGVKPLYYFFDDDVVIFGSEIKAILAHPRVRVKVCYPALNEYFTFQNTLTDLTLFEGIKLLPAGSYTVLEPHKTGEPTIHQYWDYKICYPPLDISEEEAAEELYRLFTQAVTRQLVSDVPVASYLSGGMDSGSITAIASKNLGRLLSFTCGFDLTSVSGLELAIDERANAEVLANLLKTEHYEVVLHSGDMEYVMPKLIWHLEDFRVGQCYQNYYVARLASKFVKVILSGAGGDELFGGYPWRYYRGLNSTSEESFYKSYYDFWQRLVPDEEKPLFFNEDVSDALSGHSSFDVFRQTMAMAGLPLKTNEDFVNTSLYFELKTFLHGLLVIEDKISMANSLETRVPFLDNDLVDFALRLPVHYKVRNLNLAAQGVDENEAGKRIRYEMRTGDGKMVLRNAMAHVIPGNIKDRVKQGFVAPDASWYRGESIDYIYSLLHNPRARIYEYLNPVYVNQKLDEHVTGTVNRRLFIWGLLSFEWWLRKFLPN